MTRYARKARYRLRVMRLPVEDILAYRIDKHSRQDTTVHPRTAAIARLQSRMTACRLTNWWAKPICCTTVLIFTNQRVAHATGRILTYTRSKEIIDFGSTQWSSGGGGRQRAAAFSRRPAIHTVNRYIADMRALISRSTTDTAVMIVKN